MEEKGLDYNKLIISKINKRQEVDENLLKNQFVSLYHYHNELTSSLRYAERIQKGMLPKERHFKRLLLDYFVLYQPQSYVSGDFYWLGEVNDYVLFAVGDCTGHGVPGALLTMLAQSFLNHIILGRKLIDTSEILKEFDKKFIETFADDVKNNFQNDWIDISLCCYHKKKKQVQFSGAKRKILLVSKSKNTIFKGVNYPLGGWQIEHTRSFESQTINVATGDILFLGSDGFQDQFGGNNSKKFGSKKLHNLLIEIAKLPCKKQLMVLKHQLKKWTENEPQVDDICLMGVRF